MYDLRGLTGEQCPECGQRMDLVSLTQSSIPWVYRKGLGIPAFLKTAWRATFKTQMFCMEVARPVALADARAFRRRLVLLLTFTLWACAILLTLIATEAGDPVDQLWQNRPGLTAMLVLMALPLIWGFLMGITGLHMYWFHPRNLSIEQQNRAIALSHYACAPLIGLVFSAFAIVLASVFATIAEDVDSIALGWVALLTGLPGGLSIILAVTAFLFVCARMAQHTAHRSGVTRLILWLVLPVLWLLWSALLFGVLPITCFYVYLMLQTW